GGAAEPGALARTPPAVRARVVWSRRGRAAPRTLRRAGGRVRDLLLRRVARRGVAGDAGTRPQAPADLARGPGGSGRIGVRSGGAAPDAPAGRRRAAQLWHQRARGDGRRLRRVPGPGAPPPRAVRRGGRDPVPLALGYRQPVLGRVRPCGAPHRRPGAHAQAGRRRRGGPRAAPLQARGRDL
ncbi:MAG: hypothetical protein AVDCRST_MAG68-3607, partial [uncultured Gemmatimonadetes bacterium]